MATIAPVFPIRSRLAATAADFAAAIGVTEAQFASLMAGRAAARGQVPAP
jgi:hypothetical protein